MTKLNLLKLHTETARISEEFGVELRSAYAIDIVDSGGVMWAIPEKWFFRYLLALEMLEERNSKIEEPENTTLGWIDEEIERRIEANCAARHR